MFAKTIIDSDAFLDMPLSAQALYFHLSMRADDEGFINNPKKIQRMVGASDDDAKLLVAKRFLIPFESGVVVVKHWRIHNYIQRDRFKPTVYQNEKSLLYLKENGAYSIRETDTECIHDVHILETQDRIGKDSIGKVRLGKDSMIYTSVSETEEIPEEEPETEVSDAQRYDYEWYKTTYNAVCGSLTSVRFVTDKRKKLVREFEKLYGRETFEELCRKAEASSFLSGRKNPGGWRADFDFLLRKDKIPAILEGQYDDFGQPKTQTDRWN